MGSRAAAAVGGEALKVSGSGSGSQRMRSGAPACGLACRTIRRGAAGERGVRSCGAHARGRKPGLAAIGRCGERAGKR
jgi:hypothetical protein